MPRVSIRKLFVYFLAVASCILLALNIQQRATGLFTSSLTPSGPTGPSGPVSALTGLRTVVEETPPTPTRHALDGSVLDPGDRSIPDISHRPWYMKDGEIRPTQSKVSEETGERLGMIKSRSTENFEVRDPQKPYVFDQFKFSRFFPVVFGCSFSDSAHLFGFLSKFYGFLTSNLKLFC